MSTRRVGRPSLPAAQKRTIEVKLRFSQEEAAIVDRAAVALSLRRAAYCRQAVMGVRIRSQVDRSARRELRRIGNNLNQLAHHANATGQLQELLQLRAALAELRVKVREL